MTTYYVDGAVGSDANLGTSEGAGNAWLTIDHAMNTVVAGDLVYVKASATYVEQFTIDTVGTSASPIMFEGYTTTPGDGGMVTVDGSGSTNVGLRAAVTAAYYIFMNFTVSSSTSIGFGNAAVDNIIYYNCIADSNATVGFQHDNYVLYIKCQSINNSGLGIDADLGVTIIGCIVHGNGSTSQINTLSAPLIVLSSQVTGLGSGDNAIKTTAQPIIVGSTIDGENAATTIGIDCAVASTAWFPIIINNILYDLNIGVDLPSASGFFAIGYNLINSNNTDYNNCSNTLGNDVTGAPAFTDEAGDDYTLGSGSPAIAAGLDAGT